MDKSSLYLKQIPVGPMANFSYLIGSFTTKQCMVVDPAWDVAQILAVAKQDDMEITGILVSHYHPDHIGGHYWGHDISGVKEMLEHQALPVYAQKPEIEGIRKLTGLQAGDLKVIDPGERLKVGDIEITCLHTPGHTPGSQCFLCQGALVSGDTLFLSGCGRVDLPGGNPDDLYYSLSNTIAKLPDSTIVFPGHHYDKPDNLPLAQVKTINPYLQISSLDQWRQVMASR